MEIQDFDASNSATGAAMFTWDDFDLEELAGSGTFASVYQVKLRRHSSLSLMCTVSNGDDDDSPDEETDLASGESSLSTAISKSPHFATSRFALKKLSEETLICENDARIAKEGIQLEAEILSRLLPPHANIVRLYGMSSDFFTKPETGFLILEYLVETLEERLKRWRNFKTFEKNRMTVVASCREFFDRRSGEGQKQQLRSKHIALGVAEALRFLHHHRLLYRDLKPANIGFDGTGQVRLFDFGLARFYTENDADRKLTGCVGSLRYMSPEVAKGERYGFPADLYSFSLLLWEICTLQRPFSHARSAQHLTKMAFIGNKRPSLKKVVSSDIKLLLRTGWSPDPDARPSFASVVLVLRSSATTDA